MALPTTITNEAVVTVDWWTPRFHQIDRATATVARPTTKPQPRWLLDTFRKMRDLDRRSRTR